MYFMTYFTLPCPSEQYSVSIDFIEEVSITTCIIINVSEKNISGNNKYYSYIINVCVQLEDTLHELIRN